MRKLFGLFLLALVFLAPDLAQAANRFWVGGTGTWDGSNTTNWSTTTGGAGGASVPGTADTAIFDASSGGGTVTVASSIGGTNTILGVTAGAFTGTLDFSANNPSLTLTNPGLNFSGSGARKFLMGSGTFTFTVGNGTVFDLSTVTNLDGTSDFSGATYTISATTTSPRTFAGGGRTYGTLSIAANTSKGQVAITGANTFSTVSLAAGTWLTLPAASTTTISNAVTWTGTSSNPIMVQTNNTNSGLATISIASGTSTCDYCGLFWIPGTGGGTFNATNSFDYGRNTGWTITAPTGGGGGGRIIGG